MERISIKRSIESIDGKLINYLNSGPLGMSSTEAIMLALRAYWLPLALKKHGQSFEDVQEAAAWAMSILQAQANTISVNCKIGLTNTVISLAHPPTPLEVSTDSDQNEQQHQHSLDDDDDDWSMDLHIPEEVVAISKTLGGIE
jgi:hypothetical protein